RLAKDPRPELQLRLLARSSPIVRFLQGVRVVPFHPSLREFQFTESKFSIQLVSVFCRKHPAPETLKLRMRDDHFHQPVSQALPLKRIEDKHIGDPRERRVIGYDSRESNLLIAFVHTKRQRVVDRPLNRLD